MSETVHEMLFRESYIAPTPASRKAAKYMHGPKHLGGIEAGELLDIAQTLLEDPHHSRAVSSNQIVASAMVEAILTKPDDGTLQEQRVTLVNEFITPLYETIADVLYHQLETGFRHPDDQEGWLRAMIDLAHVDLYRDIVRGHITPEVRKELIERLQGYARYTKVHRSSTDDRVSLRGLRGLHGELAFMLNAWKSIEASNMAIIPSTFRGGNGSTDEWLSRFTHDFVAITFNENGVVTNADTYEIKTLNSLNPLHLVRYGGVIVEIDEETGYETRYAAILEK